MLKYDESELIQRLASLNRPSKTAFAAACAERLLPLWKKYAQSIGEPEQGMRLEEIISAAWTVVSGSALSVEGLDGEAEAMIPDDDDDGVWSFEKGYGQNAGAAGAYAISTWLTDDPQEAAWAGRQVYDVADYLVLQGMPTLDLHQPGSEALVLGSDTVQNALAAIEEIIGAVEASPTSWDSLRFRQQAEGQELAATVP